MTDRNTTPGTPGDEPAVPRRFGRRQLLAGGGAAAAAWATSSNWLPELAIAGADRWRSRATVRSPPTRSCWRRREDHLRLHVDCYNLKLVTTAPAPRLVRIGPGAAYVVVRFRRRPPPSRPSSRPIPTTPLHRIPTTRPTSR